MQTFKKNTNKQTNNVKRIIHGCIKSFVYNWSCKGWVGQVALTGLHVYQWRNVTAHIISKAPKK